jgi:hypothetical protein
MTRRKVISMGLTTTALLAATLAGSGTQGAAAAGSDYWVVAGDQATNRLIAYDPAATDWTIAGAAKWSWHPTTGLGFTSAEISAFAHVTDFKLRNTSAGQRVVLTASDGLAAIISYPAGVKQWAQVLPTSANLHSAELLPNGNLAITSTNETAGWVRVYASSQGARGTNYAEYPLNNSHGVVWDPTTERLWAIGKQGAASTDPRVLVALAVTGSAAQPRLTGDAGRWNQLPDIGSHDLTPDPNDPNILLMSTASHTYTFDKTASSNAFTSLSDLVYVKAISRQPSGQLVQTQADRYKTPTGNCSGINNWCTDTVDFYGPDTTRTVPHAQFYRARVWNPYYNAIGDTVHGPVSDRSRAIDGTWSTAEQIDTNSSIGTIAATTLPDGTLHVLTLVPGSGVWDRTRSASGSWSASSSQIDSNKFITDVSAAGLPDGTLHVQTVVPDSGVWDRTRDTSGGWSSATKIDNNGAIAAVSAAGLPDGTLHVQTLVPGSGVWDRTRDDLGTWSSSSQIATGCAGTSTTDPCIDDISAAALPDNTLRVQTLTPGRGVSDQVRNASGLWSTPSLIDANSSITAMSAAALSDGTLHVQTVVPGHGLWDRTWSTSGTWSSATKLDANTAIFDAYGAGLDGNLHVGSAAYAG